MRLEILNVVYKLKSAYFGDMCSAVDAPPADLHAILTNLTHEGYLFPVASSNGPYRLTNQGREYRLELEKTADAEAKNEAQQAEAKAERAASGKKQFRNDFKIAVVSSFLSAVVTLTFEHFDVMIELIKKLFVML